MQIELSFLVIIDILAIATAFMLGLLFLTVKTENRKGNIFLGLFLWSLTIEILGTLAQNTVEKEFIIVQTSLFTILFLFLYVQQTINNDFKKWYIFLFIPGIFLNLLIWLIDENPNIRIFEYIFNIGLLLFILKTLQNHKKNVSHYYSNMEYKTLSWIKTIVFLFLGFHLLWIIEDIVGLGNEKYTEPFAILSAILTFFMVYWIGYNGFSQHEIFKKKLFLRKNENEIEAEHQEKQTYSPDQFQKFENIKKEIQKRKLFSDPKLNLRILAEALNIKEKELSKLINQYAQTNFYHFINDFRIKEFKKLLQSSKAKQLSIIGLAEEAGFSSKSTFYSAFKAVEGTTPKQYEKTLKKSE